MARAITKFRHVQINPGNLWVGDGDPDTTLNGGDVHIEGTLEVDGAFNMDGALALGNTLTIGEDGTGYDVIFYGDTASSYFHYDADTDSLLLIGAASKFRLGTFSGATAGSGSALSATNSAAFRVYADDGGAAIGSGTLARGGVFRHLLTYTGGNREQEAAGVIGQLVSSEGTNRHNMAGVWGSYEARTSLIVDGQAATTDTWCQAAIIGRVGGASITINTNGVLAGVAAMSNVATALAANNGIYPAFYAGKWAGTETWTHGIYIQHNAVDKALQVGELSSTAQTGIHLTSTNNNVIDSFADDNDTTLGDAVYSNIRARTMLFKACTAGTIVSVKGQIKLDDEADLGPGVFAPVQGYLELYDDADVKSGGKVWGVDSSIEAPSGGILTVDSGGLLAGFHAELTGAGTLTDNGTTAGLYIDEQITSGNWGYGVYMVGTAVKKAIQIGTLSSVAQTGVALSSTTPNVIDSFADDNNTALTNAVYTNVRARTMLFQTPTEGSLFSVLGQIKCADEVDFNPGVFAGVRGYLETMDDTDVKSGAKVWGVEACLDATLASCTVKSGGILAGLHAELTGAGTFTQDSTGILAGLYIDETVTTGKWGYGIYVTGADKAFYNTATLTGSSALNNIDTQVTDATTPSSGYSRSIYANHTNSGAKTGSAEVNVISADFDASANVTTAYCFTGYTGALSGATINRVAGYAMYIDAITGTVGASSCAHLETNGGASINDFISMRKHGGTIHAMISDRSGGATATYFLHFNGANDPVSVDAGATGANSTHKIACQIGATTAYIALFADY